MVADPHHFTLCCTGTRQHEGELIAQANQPLPAGVTIAITNLTTEQPLITCSSSPCTLTVTTATPVIRYFDAILLTSTSKAPLATSNMDNVAWIALPLPTVTPQRYAGPGSRPRTA